MRWTREPLYKTSGWFNQEPLTTLDETLRFPTALDEIYRLAYEEYGISVRKKEIKIHNGYIYFRPFSDYIFQVITQPQFYSKLPNLFSQLGQARENFDQLVKEFLEELDTVRKVDLKILSNKKLYKHLLETIRFDAQWIFKLGGGSHTLLYYFSESLLKILHTLLVQDPNSNNYSEFLIGYPNKLLEADRAFWQVVQGKLPKEEYLSKYGYRATDATLIKPTVGEDEEEFEQRVDEFRKLTPPDFDQLTESATQRRKKREGFIEHSFRGWIPFSKTLFGKTLALARKYVSVREDRRFYYTMGTYLIRRVCLELGSRFDFLNEPLDIFFMTKDELETAVCDPKIIDENEIRKRIISRKTKWQSWRGQTPPNVIED